MRSHRFENAMHIKIRSPHHLGLLVRAARKTQQLRMDDVAGSTGVGHVFVREVERGKPTVQLGRVMKLLAELGIELEADVPADVMPEFSRLQSVGVKPLPPRRRGSRVGGRRDDAAST
jgi:transcriptional regulator with XRE-family HTH domain